MTNDGDETSKCAEDFEIDELNHQLQNEINVLLENQVYNKQIDYKGKYEQKIMEATDILNELKVVKICNKDLKKKMEFQK